MNKKRNSPSERKTRELLKNKEVKSAVKANVPFDFNTPGIESDYNADITDLKIKNEELLTTQSKLLKSIDNYIELFEFAPVGYFILDKTGIILNVNQMGSSLLGSKKNLLIGKQLNLFMGTKLFQNKFNLHRKRALETSQKQQGEFELKRKKDAIFYTLIESSVIKDENHDFRFLFTAISDITLQKEQEHQLELSLKKEKELNEMKSQFIAIASHEFRTPLTTILSSTELIEKYSDQLDDEKKQKHYRKIKTSVHRLKEILIDFLSANEIENGAISIHPETFDIAIFLEEVLNEVRAFNGIHSLTFRHTGIDKLVTLDKKLLKTCLSNLIINAFKFSPAGGNIKITTDKKTNGELVITIKDHGIGIPESEQSNIFNTFFRAKNTNEIQGTGMGLNITRKLLAEMGGSISFKSKENKGTTFFIKFPA